MVKKSSYFSIDPNTMEEISNNNSNKFFYVSIISYAHRFTNREYPWHWHNTVQFFRILEGELDYILPSGTYTFRKGDIGFINSNILHMLRCQPDKHCVFEEHVFPPHFVGGLLQSAIMERYVSPITDYKDFDIFRFPVDHEFFPQFETYLKESNSLYVRQTQFYEIYIHEKISLAWTLFYEMSKPFRKKATHKSSTTRLKHMLSYINDHFTENLTIPMIAEAGLCSYRECTRTFSQQLHTTPLDYLTGLRLTYACNLLKQTRYSITEVASRSGFNSSSYFSKIFRQNFSMSPKDYRNQYIQDADSNREYPSQFCAT